MKNKILITTSSFNDNHPELQKLSNDFNAEVIFNPYKRRLSSNELLKLLAPDVIAMVAGVEKIDRVALNSSPSLKVISRCGVGADNVDKVAAKEQGIDIFITPDAPTQAVAELAVGLMISALRKIPHHNELIKQGLWERQSCGLMNSKTVGLLGFGRIGQRVAKILFGFGAKIIYFDLTDVDSDQASRVSAMDHLFKESDIISLHMPATESTRGMFNYQLFNKMKNNVVLVNTARGDLINEGDLYAFLKHNPEAIAALDVFCEEPYGGPLTKLPNIIFTPHIGSFAKEARFAMEQQALKNLIFGLEKNGENKCLIKNKYW